MTVAKEETRDRGAKLAAKVKTAIHEGNMHRITIKDSQGRTVMKFPVTVGLVAFFAAPAVSTAAVLAGAAADWSLQVDRVTPPEQQEPSKPEEVPSDQPLAVG